MLSVLVVNATYMKVVRVKSQLNIREGAGTEFAIIGKVGNGDLVEFISESNSEWSTEASGTWYQIKYGDIQGWVKSEYLETTDELPKDIVSGNKSSLQWSDIVPENDVLKLFFYIVLFFLGIVLLLLVIMFLCWLWSIIQMGLGVGLIGAVIGFIITKNYEGGFTGFNIGFGLGCVFGLYHAIRKPGDAIDVGASGLGTFISSSSSSSSVSSHNVDKYDTVIEGAGIMGSDVKGKKYFDGTIEGEDGKWYKTNSDGTVSEDKS